MDPLVESALISAATAIVSVGATAAVAIFGLRSSRSANQATIDAAHADVLRALDTTREGQLADRYTKAIEQLGSNVIDVTIGGIYALERIARDSPRDHPTVMEVLAACIREHASEQWPEPDEDGTPHERSTRPDIQAALTVIGRRDAQHDIQPIDLAGANLTAASLAGANLAGANLTEAVLIRADLKGTDLVGAKLTHAKLRGAILLDAVLTGAKIDNADLYGAALARANFTDAYLSLSDLTATNPADANLTGAVLTSVAWPSNAPVPRGWEPNPHRPGRLRQASKKSADSAAN